jgi:hypothetical protein
MFQTYSFSLKLCIDDRVRYKLLVIRILYTTLPSECISRVPMKCMCVPFEKSVLLAELIQFLCIQRILLQISLIP